MSNRVRPTDDGLARISASIGASTFHGITVQGHCMGIVARTWRLPSQPAGYGTAFDGAQAVMRAGRMRTSTNPPVGAIPWWAHRSSDNRPGHVATINRPGFCLGNVGSTIQEAALSRFGNLRWLGWCWPADVPGWGDVATPPPTIPEPEPEPEPIPAPTLEEVPQMLVNRVSSRLVCLLHAGRLISLQQSAWHSVRDDLPTLDADEAQWAALTRAYGQPVA